MTLVKVAVMKMERCGQDSGLILESEAPGLSFGTNVGSER